MMRTMILTAGGPRSLVATALALAEPRRQAVGLLHVKGAGPGAEVRLIYARKQAAHFGRCKLIEIEPPAAGGGPSGPTDAAGSDLLAAAADHAAAAGIERIIWPAQFDGDFAALADATERVMLLRHAMLARKLQAPRIETPLAELTDVQLFELGSAMDVPWQLARSCNGAGEEPCGECPGCSRRMAAFAALLLDDPYFALGATGKRRLGELTRAESPASTVQSQQAAATDKLQR